MRDLTMSGDGSHPDASHGRGHIDTAQSVPVVVAEHDDQSRHQMLLALTQAGYTPHQVTEGASTLELLQRTRPPLIVIAEETLPEIGGFQLAGLLSLKPGAESRYSAIVLTSDLQAALRRSLHRKLDAIALEILVKPFHVNELLIAVEIATDRLMGKRPHPRGAGDADFRHGLPRS